MATSFNPANTSSGITLSNGNLTATVNSTDPGTHVNAFSLDGESTGKFYWEIVCGIASGAGRLGIATTGASLSTGFGADTQSYGWDSSGQVFFNGASVATIQGFGNGNTVATAVDIGNLLIWFQTAGGNWNNSGTANPATGIGGISIGSIASLPLLIPVELAGPQSGDFFTLQSAPPFTFSPPSGFIQWGPIPATTTGTPLVSLDFGSTIRSSRVL